MAFESVRGYVQLASGLGELTMAKAMEAAQGLLALPGADEVTRKVVQASTLAEELLDVAKSNRANLVALVQGEVETALKRADVARVADLEAARTALAGVSRELFELKALVVTTGASAVAGASRGTLGRSGAVSTATRPMAPPAVASTPSPAPSSRPVRRAKSTAKSTAKAPDTKAAPRQAAPRAAATKAAAKKATTAKKTTATKATTTPRKTAAKKTTAKKTTTPRKTAAKKTTAKKTTTPRKTAAKKTTAKKTTAGTATKKATS